MKIKNLLTALAISIALFAFGDTETVTNVRGVQRENSKLVDIYYDLNATDYGTYTVGVEIEGRTIPVTATTFTGDVGEGVTPGSNRHIIWNAGADWPNKKGDVKAIVTATKEDPTVSHGKVQLWEGGPYWADRNIGADNPWESGYYFWWGDTVGYKREKNVWVASDGSSSGFSFDRYDNQTDNKLFATLQSEGWITADGVLTPNHDAAHVKWGGTWRMPTEQELSYLNNKCDWTWTMMNGVNGYVVRGRGNYASNSIFLPAAGDGCGTSLYYAGSGGCYWSSVSHSSHNRSWYLDFSSSDHFTDCAPYRRLGFPVRPVQGLSE